MKINSTPVRTSKNYDINDFEISSEILQEKVSKTVKVSLKNFQDCCVENSWLDLPKHALSEELNSELKNPNLSLKIKIDKNNIGYRILNIDLSKKTVAKVLFEIDKNVKTKLIIKINSLKEEINNCFVKFVCEENSFADVLFICNCEKAEYNLLCLENKINNKAKLNYTFVDFSAKYSVLNFYSSLENDAECCFKNLYLANSQSKVDLNIYQDLFGVNSVAKSETVGALLGESHKNYKGTINFNRGAKKSVGEENELCMILSNKAKSKALPMLLCQEEDVDGSHSTAIGKINEKELFYLMSRGLTKSEALNLFLKAKFNIILKDIDNNIKTEIFDKIDRKIENEKL